MRTATISALLAALSLLVGLHGATQAQGEPRVILDAVVEVPSNRDAGLCFASEAGTLSAVAAIAPTRPGSSPSAVRFTLSQAGDESGPRIDAIVSSTAMSDRIAAADGVYCFALNGAVPPRTQSGGAPRSPQLVAVKITWAPPDDEPAE